MPVLANIEVIWVIIIIGSVIAQIIKGAKKVAAQAPKATGADEATSGGSKSRDFIAPDEALQEFLLSRGAGEKPADRPAAASPVQAISARRGLSQARAIATPLAPKKVKREVRQPVLPPPIAAMPQPRADKVQQAVVLEKYIKRETSASLLGEAIRKDLSNAEAIRKAIVLREVLGPPVALR